MQILRLGTEDWLPNAVVGGLTSKIWTERHLDPGEFQLKTPRIEETMALIPEGSFITEQSSDEVMLVETHTIDEDDDGVDILTVKGSSFEVFLKGRYMLDRENYNTPWAMPQNYKVHEAAEAWLWNAVINGTGIDRVKPPVPPIEKNFAEVIPNARVTEGYVDTSEEVKEWWVGEGEVYAKLMEFLTIGDLGIRSIRPYVPQLSGTVVSLDASSNIVRTTPPGIPYLQLQIYKGRNRTETPELGLDPISIRYDMGHISKPSFVISSKDLKNFVHVTSNITQFDAWTPVAGDIPMHLDLRMLVLDGGNISDDVDPVDFERALQQQAEAALIRYNRKVMVDGAISARIPWKYRQHYYLGDTVTVVGKYGIKENMQVNEYIRSEDEKGETAYPTLIRKDA